MIWRIDVSSKSSCFCWKISSAIKDLGLNKEVKVYSKKTFLLDADLDINSVERIAQELLIDPITEQYSLIQGLFKERPPFNEVLIAYKPGVCDAVAMSLEKAIGGLALNIRSARTARFYRFEGLGQKDILSICSQILYNPLIEHILEYKKLKNIRSLDSFLGQNYNFKLINIDILKGGNAELLKISKKRHLSLNLNEMKIIQNYFKNLGRNPTDCELETIAILWSEHCAHKTFRGVIEYQEKDTSGKVIKEEIIDGLLKTTIIKATKEINSSDCLSVFDDNSGVVNFDQDNNICFKVETHNHPSALEPYGGASTGIGGVIRDILGTGCSAKPFASLDVFCFSDWNLSPSDLPFGLLHPKRIIKGVVKGVRDYGNRMGIPTVAGAVSFEERFLGNPLVYCGTLGIIPKEKSFKKLKPEDLIILCGAKTGRDGIHGATFSSKEIGEDTVSLTSAVQIGNPIEEKKLAEAILRARDEDLFNAITDCGAGGISSAITELGKLWGVEVNLDKVPLKYSGLSYTEIWISESQERMVFFAEANKLKKLKKIFAEEDVELTVVGKVTNTKRLKLYYRGNKVCDLDMDFIFNLPKLKKQAFWIKRSEKDFKLKEKDNYSQDLRAMLARPNIACKDWILREYDHEVQAGSVIKSILGIEKTAVSDGAVIRPDLESEKCVILGLGINPFYSDFDPYWMAALSLDEALRNVICLGAKLDKTFILDNFSWGAPTNKKILGGLVRAAKACYDFSTYFGTPFISGKDSLYNEYDIGKKHISIPGTLLISALAITDNWQNIPLNYFSREGNLIYLLGLSRNELGSSEYFRSRKIKKGIVPKVEKKEAKRTFELLSQAIEKNLVNSCHDCSEGGLAVAISEMCLGSDLGATVFLAELPGIKDLLNYEALFSESPSRFIVEVSKDKKEQFEKTIKDVPFGLIGCLSEKKKLVVYGKQGKEIINIEIEPLRNSWMSTFEEFR